MRGGKRDVLLAAMALAVTSALAVDPIELQIRPVWMSLSAGKFRFPLLVKIRNNTSSDATGRLSIDDSGGSILIPLEVAKQSEKEVPIFAILENSMLRLSYDSNISVKRVEVPMPEDYAIFRLGLIGDTSGDLAFLKMKRQARGAVITEDTVNLGYCRPEDAPERPAGYFALDAVFLGEGSERLNERQISALQQYILQGGRLVMPGGANAPWLSIAAWRSVLPIKNAAPKTFPHGIALTMSGRYGTIKVDDPITLMLGEPAASHLDATTSAQGVVSVVRPVGLGSVVFLGYNPFDDPLLSHPNRRQLVLDAMKVAQYGGRSTRAQELLLARNQYEILSYAGPGPRSYPASPSEPQFGLQGLYSHTEDDYTENLSNTPFNVQLIPSATVGWIFFGFFFAVIPLNFIVLRVIKKLELAWVTAPVLSIAFAWILLSYSKGLYSAKLSRAYQGLVVQDLDTGLCAQWLRASYFMPQGGTYNLTLANTDQLLPNDAFDSDQMRYRYFGGGEGETASVSLDQGEATLPEVDVPNLAFREFTYGRVNTPAIPVELDVSVKNGRLEGTVTNKTKGPLSRVAIVRKERTYVLPDLGPGLAYRLTSATPVLPSKQDLISSGRSGDQVVLFAVMKQFDPGGPGVAEPRSTKVLLICTKGVSGS